MRRIFQFLFLSLVLLACAAGAAAWWLSQPLTLRNPTVELEIEPGTAPRAVAQTAVAAGVQTDARLLYAWFRLSGKDRQIRAGNYEILPGTTPYSLLQKLVQGDGHHGRQRQPQQDVDDLLHDGLLECGSCG